MGKVFVQKTMSLDGFIAGPQDDIKHLFRWYFSGNTEMKNADGMVFKVSRISAELLQNSWHSIGAIVDGRRDFDVSGGYGGKPPLPVPHFVVTHHVPQEWAESPFTFVTDGVESAVEKAKAAAGKKNVAVSGANITQQCIKAGLLDEIHIDLVPLLLGAGIRLFDQLDTVPTELEITQVVESHDVTHLRYRIVK